MKATFSMLFMFIHMDDVSNVETQFGDVKFWNFVSLWEMAKNTIKLYWKFFLHKLTKNVFTFAGMTLLCRIQKSLTS